MPTYIFHPCDEGVVRSQADVPDCAPATGRWVLAAAILGSSITFIDGQCRKVFSWQYGSNSI